MRKNRRVERRWERAHEFLELPAAAIEARVRAVYPAAGLKDAQPLNRGLRNTNYRLTVVGAPSPLALRLYVADPAAWVSGPKASSSRSRCCASAGSLRFAGIS